MSQGEFMRRLRAVDPHVVAVLLVEALTREVVDDFPRGDFRAASIEDWFNRWLIDEKKKPRRPDCFGLEPYGLDKTFEDCNACPFVDECCLEVAKWNS